MHIRRREVLKAIGGIAATAFAGQNVASAQGAKRRFEGETLRVLVTSGSEGQAMRTHIVTPFMEETGAQVLVTEGLTQPTMTKLRAERANPSVSVCALDDYGIIALGREGLLEEIEPSRLTNLPDINPKFVIEKKGVCFFVAATGIIYNNKLVTEPPKSWKIFWDPKYKGKIAVPPPNVSPALSFAIIAATAHGGSQFKIDPAWDALRALKPNVGVMEQNVAVLAEMLRTGEIALCARLTHLFKPFIEKGYPIGVSLNVSEGVVATATGFTVVKNHPDKREVADAFIDYALGVKAQRAMAEGMWFGPTNRKVQLPADLEANLISKDSQVASLISVDAENLATNRDNWAQNYSRIML